MAFPKWSGAGPPRRPGRASGVGLGVARATTKPRRTNSRTRSRPPGSPGERHDAAPRKLPRHRRRRTASRRFRPAGPRGEARRPGGFTNVPRSGSRAQGAPPSPSFRTAIHARAAQRWRACRREDGTSVGTKPETPAMRAPERTSSSSASASGRRFRTSVNVQVDEARNLRHEPPRLGDELSARATLFPSSREKTAISQSSPLRGDEGRRECSYSFRECLRRSRQSFRSAPRRSGRRGA